MSQFVISYSVMFHFWKKLVTEMVLAMATILKQDKVENIN